jgi:thiol-disulfide isomerase/thioredoxin
MFDSTCIVRGVARISLWLVVLFASGLAAIATDGPEKDQYGKSYDLASGAKITVVDFAASWCEPCWKTLPRLQSLADDLPGVRFVVVDVDEKIDGRDRLVAGLKLRVPVLWDETQRLAQHFSPEGMPATFVLDEAGKVVYKHVGSDPKDWDRLARFLADRLS